jgi:ADP-ribose pyrophosphatase
MKKYSLRHKKFDGSWSDTISREVFERGAVAAVVPYDPVRDRIVLIEQFRPGPMAAGAQNPWMIEVVAGILEPNETPENLATRETFEETGGELTDILPICAFYMAPGSSTEYCHLFCGRIDSADIGGLHGNSDEEEDIRVFSEASEIAFTRVSKGEINTFGAVGLNALKTKLLEIGASANRIH